MTSAVDYALQHIKLNIPMPILQAALNIRRTSWDMALRENIIYPIVIPRCSMVAGKVIPITLLESWRITPAGSVDSIYRIPPEYREDRTIMEVHDLRPETTAMFDGGAGGLGSTMGFMPGLPSRTPMSALQNAASAMYQSKVGGGGSGAPIVEKMEGNLIKLHGGYQSFTPWVLTCRLAYDNEMTNLNSSAVPSFGELALLITQQYCYNELYFKLDRGSFEFGMELTSVKDMLSRWSDHKEQVDNILYNFSGDTITDPNYMLNLVEDMI